MKKIIKSKTIHGEPAKQIFKIICTCSGAIALEINRYILYSGKLPKWEKGKVIKKYQLYSLVYDSFAIRIETLEQVINWLIDIENGLTKK
jgi:hypothetical protein